MKLGFTLVSEYFALLALLVAGVALVFLNAAGGVSAAGPGSNLKTIPLTIAGRTIQARVAETDSAKREGLLGWDTITEDEGMLLDFSFEGKYAIHMQGMKFPIDAVWISSTGEIRLVYEDITPNSGQVYPSMFDARYCLELKSGFCKKYQVKVGGRVTFANQGR